VRYVLDNPRNANKVEYFLSWNGTETHVSRNGTHWR
jgi:hypothetical protein